MLGVGVGDVAGKVWPTSGHSGLEFGSFVSGCWESAWVDKCDTSKAYPTSTSVATHDSFNVLQGSVFCRDMVGD